MLGPKSFFWLKKVPIFSHRSLVSRKWLDPHPKKKKYAHPPCAAHRSHWTPGPTTRQEGQEFAIPVWWMITTVQKIGCEITVNVNPRIYLLKKTELQTHLEIWLRWPQKILLVHSQTWLTCSPPTPRICLALHYNSPNRWARPPKCPPKKRCFEWIWVSSGSIIVYTVYRWGCSIYMYIYSSWRWFCSIRLFSLPWIGFFGRFVLMWQLGSPRTYPSIWLQPLILWPRIWRWRASAINNFESW